MLACKQAPEAIGRQLIRSVYLLMFTLMSPLEALEHFIRGRWTGEECIHASKHEEPQLVYLPKLTFIPTVGV
jgi:hypothetical protein